MNDLDTRIAEHLGSHARSLTIDGASVGAVMRRGRQRRTRRRTVVGVAAVATVGGATVATINVLSRPSNERSISVTGNPSGETDPSVVVTAPAGDSVLGSLTPLPSNLVWNPVVPDSLEAIAVGGFGTTQTQPPFLAMTSAPGQALTDPYSPTLYGSDDAISWTPLVSQPGVPMTSFDAYDGSIYVFSTAAATAPIEPGGAGDAVITTSSDNGESWQTEVLPLDLRSLASARGVGDVPFDSRSMAVGPAGAIAVGDLYLELNLSELGIQADGSMVSYTPDGIQVEHDPCLMTATTVSGKQPADSPGCSDSSPDTIAPTTTFYSWAELDLPANVVAELTGPPHVFVRPNGAATFTEVSFPDIGGGQIANPIALATADGFAITATVTDDGTQRTVLATSTDGTTWTTSTVPMSYVISVGQLSDGTFVAIGTTIEALSQTRTAVATSANGVDWSTPTVLDGLLTIADGRSATLVGQSTAIGPSGVTVAAMIGLDPFVENGPATLSRDGLTVSLVDQNGNMTVTDDATGGELASEVVRDPAGGVRLVADDGTTTFTLSDVELGALYDQRGQTGPARLVLLHSDDGVSWSRDDLDALAGFPARIGRVQSNGTTVLVTMLDSGDPNDDGTAKTVVLVGTPAT